MTSQLNQCDIITKVVKLLNVYNIEVFDVFTVVHVILFVCLFGWLDVLVSIAGVHSLCP